MNTIRFLREYLHPAHQRVEVRELTYDRLGESLPATYLRRPGGTGPVPTWIALHGLTFRGRRHPSLERFCRAIAASGAAVLIPEIPEWRRLEVAPAVVVPSLAGAIDMLHEERLVVPGRLRVIGFSFGATQALTALADPALGERVAALAAWGGYADLHNLFRFGFTGEYELDGIHRRTAPDPYGAWIMGANYLTRVPGHEGHVELQDALRKLAEESGRRGVYAGSAVYDPFKAELRERLSPAQREVFDLFAPPSGVAVKDRDRALELTRALADAALATDPLLDPRPFLPAMRVRTLVAHGEDDRLVPYTESVRIHRALPESSRSGCTITSLFAHSGGTTPALGPVGRVREGLRFIHLLHRILTQI